MAIAIAVETPLQDDPCRLSPVSGMYLQPQTPRDSGWSNFYELAL